MKASGRYCRIRHLGQILLVWGTLGVAMVLPGACQEDLMLETADFPEDETAFLDFPNLQIHQSMDFAGDKVVFVTPVGDKLTCDIYDVLTKKHAVTLMLPCEGYALPHANAIGFGVSAYSGTSVFPALYVSAWNNQRQAFVYDISFKNGVYTSDLIQVIDPSRVSESIIGAGYLDWAVDGEGGFLYSIAYKIKGSSRLLEGNGVQVARFRLPSLQDRTVVLEDADVTEYFSLPVIPVFQDNCFFDGHVYVAAGTPDENNLYPSCLYDIDLSKKQLHSFSIPMEGEPEGLGVYRGRKWLNMYGSSRIYNLNKLFD